MKARKLLAFLLVSTLLIGMFGFTASAMVTNANNKEWYMVNTKEELGAEKTLKVYGIRFFITDPTEEGFNGALALNSPSNGWGSKNFNFTDGGPADCTRSYVEYKQKTPFFTESDVTDGYAEVFIALWWGDTEITGHEYYDEAGNKITASVASAGGGGSASKTGDNNLLVMFGVLFVVSAAGLVVFRKRQKSH